MKRSPLRFEYEVNGVTLESVTEFRDLGVTFTKNLCFNKHVDLIVAKAYSMLGFMKRICKDFNIAKALKSIFFAHVRSHLEYASVVWFPFHQKHSDKIESIQKKFLIYALRRSVRRDDMYRLPSYVSRCESIGIEMFVFDVLSRRINAPCLHSKFRLNEPVRLLRNVNYLTLDNYRVNYGLFEPINNASRVFNMFAHLYTIAVSRYQFRAAVKSMVSTDMILQRHGFLLKI